MKKAGISTLSLLIGMAAGGTISAAAVEKKSKREIQKREDMSEKHLALMLLLNQWLITKQEGKSIVDYFHREEIKEIAIYGMSYVGERLYDELKDSDINISYCIDRNADNVCVEADVISPEDDLPPVDAIIVTAITYFEEIEEKLSLKTRARILSLEDILYEI